MKERAHPRLFDLTTLSHFCPGYVLKMKSRFEAGCDDYILTKVELQKFFACSEKEVTILMDMLDDDKNGTIDAFEFMCTMAMLSRGTLDERAALLFALYDFDESGIVTQDEFTALVFNVWTALLAMEKKERPTLNDVEFKVS